MMWPPAKALLPLSDACHDGLIACSGDAGQSCWGLRCCNPPQRRCSPLSDACHDRFIAHSSDAVAVGIVGHSSIICQPVAAERLLVWQVSAMVCLIVSTILNDWCWGGVVWMEHGEEEKKVQKVFQLWVVDTPWPCGSPKRCHMVFTRRNFFRRKNLSYIFRN